MQTFNLDQPSNVRTWACRYQRVMSLGADTIGLGHTLILGRGWIWLWLVFDERLGAGRSHKSIYVLPYVC